MRVKLLYILALLIVVFNSYANDEFIGNYYANMEVSHVKEYLEDDCSGKKRIRKDNQTVEIECVDFLESFNSSVFVFGEDGLKEIIVNSNCEKPPYIIADWEKNLADDGSCVFKNKFIN